MKFKGFYFTTLLILLFIVFETKVQASGNHHDTLILYSAAQKSPPIVEQIDAMISPYTKSKVLSYDELRESDLKGVKSVIYIGLKKEKVNLLANHDWKQQKMVIIGENIEQFKGFESIKRGQKEQIAAINGIPYEKTFQIQVIKDATVKSIVTEKSNGRGRTVILGNENKYYIPVTSMPQQLQWAIQPEIVDFFEWTTTNKRRSVIVIDQITPNTKVERLSDMAQALKDAKVPVVLAVQPLGQGDEKNRLTTFAENKKLRKKIIELQKDGATILLSGLKPVTEEASLLQSEFWQIDRDQPMKEAMDSKGIASINQNDFASENQFNDLRHEIGKKEQQITNEIWNEAIDESVNSGIIPTSLTIENDVASKYVYKELSKKTTSFIGNVQFGDSKNDRVLQPTVIHSNLLSDTAVFPINLQPNNKMDEQIAQLQQIEGAFAGVKIHVDDSLELLNSTIQKMDSATSFQWVTPQELRGEIQSDLVEITSSSSGDVTVEKPNKLLFQLKMLYKNNLFEFVLWILFGLVLLFVLLFFLNIIRLRMSLKKRLFEERKPNG
ncbi:hypothetical protein KZO01_03270 [Kurthia zopfii]|uniref:Uncharacterized protein YdaL n=1 Tax=Kurthia zopfii TaxID=1650 RepID=A0A8B4QAZ5_9BACL|nr:DUF2334 domain-containing protein [Kurthia zopfii]PWI23195.1 hypothetical protein DF281_03985 [Kurthia zopfii]TDR41376.1 uncharacterized protein YdaL [Kurthia zopfii]GEK30018.1 hypothetical protein KZO01_03270 [Kurthia zopfii]STX09881.1 Uncharacterized protein conserved in bacteria [Kurthia zopfii]